MITQPPPLPPPQPTFPQAVPVRAPLWKAILLLSGGTCLFLLTVVLTVTNVVLQEQRMMVITFIGYVFGNIVLPTLLIMGIACVWERNRRPYILIQWFFWIMTGMFGLKLMTTFRIVAAHHAAS